MQATQNEGTTIFPESIPEVPDRIAIPIGESYDKAMTENNGKASIRRLKNPQEMEELCRRSENREDIENMLVPVGSGEECPDTRLLDLLYTADLYDLWFRNYGKKNAMFDEVLSREFTGHPVSVRFARLMMACEYDRSRISRTQDDIRERLEKLKDLAGVLKKSDSTEGSHDRVYRVMAHMEIAGNPAEIRFQSPYMDRIIFEVLYAHRDTLREEGPYAMPAGHTYNILPRTVKKNAPAYDVMRSAANAIGKSKQSPVPIRLAAILEESPNLQKALDRTTSTQSRRTVLQKAFVQGWTMLGKDTDLAGKYEDIRLPNPGNKDAIPTNTNIGNLALNITYTGKKTKATNTAVSTHLKGWYAVPAEKNDGGDNMVKTETENSRYKAAREDAEIKNEKIGIVNMGDYGRNGFFEDMKKYKPRKTGCAGIDKDGGIWPGLYLIGTSVLSGEDTFPMQLAEQLAENGSNVLYFGTGKSSFEICREAAVRYKTAENYTEKIGTRLCVVDGTDAEYIVRTASSLAERGLDAAIFIDCLQNMTEESGSAKSQTNDMLHRLKILQSRFMLPVIVSCRIGSEYDGVPAGFEEFTEYGADVFAPDVIWDTKLSVVETWDYARMDPERRREAAEKAMGARTRLIDLVTVKNRCGKPGSPIRFEYDPREHRFTEREGLTQQGVLETIGKKDKPQQILFEMFPDAKS